MQEIFYVTHDGVQQGPYTTDQVLQLLNSNELQWADYCYDEASGEWVPLLQHQMFASKMQNSASPKMTLKQEISRANGSHEPNKKEWYALKEENRYGPFSYLEVVKMLQERTIGEFDYLWYEGLANWARVAELEEFAPDKIKQLQISGMADISEVFFRRRHARANYGASLIVHNNKKVFKGSSLEISAGGAGIVIEGAQFTAGESLFLHFKPGDGVPPFNAICKVVSKREIENGKNRVWRYGVEFTSISDVVQESIEEYAKRAIAA